MKLLIKLYGLNNRLTRKVIEKIVLYCEKGYCVSATLRDIYSRYHGIHIGYGSYGGCFQSVNFPKPCNIIIGNYCSIGSGLKAFRANHPADKFTTHPVLYNPIFGYVPKDLLERPDLVIGHDVWIGSNVTICPGCKKIGNGAIVGAGSIVTHDVAPYTIVAGNPAKLIRPRFTAKQITWLQQKKWWMLDLKTLKRNIDNITSEFNSIKD